MLNLACFHASGKKLTMDFSQGNALTPLTKIARYAFKQAQGDLHEYWLPTSYASDPAAGHILRGLADHFTARGLRQDGWSGVPTSCLLMTGGGTTEGYELIIRALAEDVAHENKKRDEKIKPVILMPTPTYGFFMRNPLRHHIEIATIPRAMDKGGILERDRVVEVIRALHKDGKRVVAFYDSNPHNPLGLVRGEDETNALYSVFSTLSQHYHKQDRAFCDEQRKKSGAVFMPFWAGLASRVRIIDDMAYDGLVYEGAQKPFPFAQAHDRVLGCSGFTDSFTLMSLSKAGLANMRAGLVIGPDDALNNLRALQLESGYAPPKAAMHALYAYFNDKAPYKKWRTDHLHQMNADHHFRGQLMKSLINGWSGMPEIDERQKQAMMDAVIECGIGRARAGRYLQDGLGAPIRIITNPQAGFFHLLDCNDLRGYTYRDASGRERALKEKHDIDRFMGETNMQFCGAAWMGMEDQAYYRLTFAKPVADIVACAERLRGVLSGVAPAQIRVSKKPARDLF